MGDVGGEGKQCRRENCLQMQLEEPNQYQDAET